MQFHFLIGESIIIKTTRYYFLLQYKRIIPLLMVYTLEDWRINCGDIWTVLHKYKACNTFE